MNRVAIVVPNWNGADLLKECLDSLLNQSFKYTSIIVIENGSVDSSLEILANYSNTVTVLKQEKNLGFAGGVNVGIKYAMSNGYDYVGLFNNDAVAEKDWVKNLVQILDENKNTGIATSKILIEGSKRLDSTGDWYTTTGMPFPRGRGEIDSGQYDEKKEVFGASGGASLYKVALFKDVGLFDEDFFAYYEDVDISFRAQLRGWRIRYEPSAIAYHKLSATSSKLGYFAIKQSAKNFWFLYIKNVPYPLFLEYLPSALYRYGRMFAARLIKGGFWSFALGSFKALLLFPKKFHQRHRIQKTKVINNSYLREIIYKGKPPIPQSRNSKKNSIR